MEENKPNNQLDELIRSRFEGAEEQPSNDVWNDIESRLDDTNKKRPGFIYWLSGIALVFIITGTVLYFQQHVHSDKAVIADNSSVVKIIDNNVTNNNSSVTSTNSTEIKTGNETTSNTTIAKENNLTANSTKEEIKNKTEKSAAKNTPSENSKQTTTTTVNINNTTSDINSSNKTNRAKEKKEDTSLETKTKNNVVAIKTKQHKNNESSDLNSTTNKQITATSPQEKSTQPGLIAVINTKITIEKKTDEQKTSNVSTQKDTKAAETAKKDSIAFAATETKKANDKLIEQKKIIDQQKTTTDSIAQGVTKKENTDSVATKKDSVKTVAGTTPTLSPKKDSIKPITDAPVFSRILSLYFSPDYYQNTIKDNSGQFAKDEKQINRYSAGLKFAYVVLDKLSVRIGVSYSELKQQLTEHTIYFNRYLSEPFIFHSSLGDMAVDPDVMRNGFSALAPPSVTQFKFKYTYSQQVQFISIPLEVKYGFTRKHFGLSVLAGLNSQYTLKQHTELDLIKENVTNTLEYSNLNINKISFAGILGLSLDYRLTNRFSIFLEPTARMNFTSLTKSTAVRSNPLFVGANAGLAFHF